MRFPFGKTITVLRDSPGGLDKHNDPVASTTASATIAHCGVAPRYSSEPNTLARNGVIIGFTIFAPSGSDIIYTDRIKIDGLVYDIEGEPANWSSPFTGTEFGMEFAVKRAIG